MDADGKADGHQNSHSEPKYSDHHCKPLMVSNSGSLAKFTAIRLVKRTSPYRYARASGRSRAKVEAHIAVAAPINSDFGWLAAVGDVHSNPPRLVALKAAPRPVLRWARPQTVRQVRTIETLVLIFPKSLPPEGLAREQTALFFRTGRGRHTRREQA